MLTSLYSSVENASAKLETLTKEGSEMLDTHTHASRVIQELDECIRSTLYAVDPSLDVDEEGGALTLSLQSQSSAIASGGGVGGVFSPQRPPPSAYGTIRPFSQATSAQFGSPVSQPRSPASPAPGSRAPRRAGNLRVSSANVGSGGKQAGSTSAPSSPRNASGAAAKPPVTASVTEDDGDFTSTIAMKPYKDGAEQVAMGGPPLNAAKETAKRKMYGPVHGANTPMGQSGVVWFFGECLLVGATAALRGLSSRRRMLV